jgi:protein SCO1/2
VPVRARLAIFLAATFIIVAVGASVLLREPPAAPVSAEPEGALRPPNMPPAEFSLRDQDGKVATLDEYRGKVVAVTFLYTTCEDTCPLAAQQIRGALDRLGHDVPVLAFAVDPPRDTETSARTFLAKQKMTGRMRFLVGERKELEPVWKAYGIQPQGEGFEHSASVVLLDGRGVQRIGFPVSQLTPERLAHDLRLLEALGS